MTHDEYLLVLLKVKKKPKPKTKPTSHKIIRLRKIKPNFIFDIVKYTILILIGKYHKK